MRRYAVTGFAVITLLLVGCSATEPAEQTGAPTVAGSVTSTPTTEPTQERPAEPLDLAGQWQQTNSNSADSYQRAVITENTISIDWVNDSESMTAVYWVGTYVPPNEPGDAYTWNSQNDTTQTENALMASSDATKTFTYRDGVLSYELTAVGVTMTVEMQRQ